MALQDSNIGSISQKILNLLDLFKQYNSYEITVSMSIVMWYLYISKIN